jgi:hypothetical protein
MKQVGNLSIVCAQRRDTLLQVLNGKVSVHVGYGPDRETLSADWTDDVKIMEFIMELNHGRLQEKKILEVEAA